MPNEEKRSVKVRIFGSEYQVKGEADPEYMERLARLVDEKMREIAQPGTAQAPKAAILAAFNLADELTRTKQALEERKMREEEMERRAVDLDLELQSSLYPGLAPQGEELSLPLDKEENEPQEGSLEFEDLEKS